MKIELNDNAAWVLGIVAFFVFILLACVFIK